MRVVNIIGGPGVGKSTLAASIFAKLKATGADAELVTERAKDLVWDEASGVVWLDQLLLFAEQRHRLARLEGKVDIAVTDSPLLLSLVYGETSDVFKNLVRYAVSRFTNLNYYVERVVQYSTLGRNEADEEAARVIDRRIENVLRWYEHTRVRPNSETQILKDLRNEAY